MFEGIESSLDFRFLGCADFKFCGCLKYWFPTKKVSTFC